MPDGCRGPPLAGSELEWELRQLIENGENLTIKKLDGKSKPTTIQLLPSKIVYFSSGRLAEVFDDPEALYIPSNPNECAVDLIAPGPRIIQVTLNEKHDIKLSALERKNARKKAIADAAPAATGLTPIANALGLQEAIDYFWAVPGGCTREMVCARLRGDQAL
jgi:hypothetical protein